MAKIYKAKSSRWMHLLPQDVYISEDGVHKMMPRDASALKIGKLMTPDKSSPALFDVPQVYLIQ